MKLNRTLLKGATDQGLLTEPQAQQLWDYLAARSAQTPGLRATHVLYYLGGCIAIGAMTLFMTLGWERFGGWGIVCIALAYAAAGIWLTESLLRKHLRIPAGITAAFVIALTPLAVYGLQSALGLWAEGHAYRDYHRLIDWRWLLMELATLACGAVMLWRYRLPFLVMPVAVTLWYMSMDLTPFLFGGEENVWEQRKLVSLCFGLLMIALAFRVDLRARGDLDYAFWLYLFGVAAFWGGLSSMDSDSELSKFAYLCVNLAMIGIGTLLGRRVFAIVGGLGAAGYFGHLAYDVFQDSMLFPFVLTFLGLGVIYLGTLWQRHEERLSSRLRRLLPAALRELVDARAGAA